MFVSKIKSLFIKNKVKEETKEEKIERILKLCEDVDCGMLNKPMKPQVALNELCRYLLGEDWYVADPLSQEQVNTQIVYEIETRYKDVNRR